MDTFGVIEVVSSCCAVLVPWLGAGLTEWGGSCWREWCAAVDGLSVVSWMS